MSAVPNAAPPHEIGGFAAPGFEPVAAAFARNFGERGELGAAFAAVHDGRPVVDLWGGVADRAAARAWDERTLALVFSGTKGLTALVVALLLERGALELARPVADYWPEFAVRGKERITVAELVSHRARLPGMRATLTEDDLLDDRRMAALLAAQAPESDPRAALIYHPLTWGWLCGELIRRVAGRTVGAVFAQEVAAPLGLELWIGLPVELEPRVAVLEYGSDWGHSPMSRVGAFPHDDLWRAVWENPPLFGRERVLWNLPALHRAELAGSNAIGSARSLARMYGCLARGGELDGVRLLSEATIALVRTPLASGLDPFLGSPQTYGVGFALNGEQRPFGPPPDGFGAAGAGGSVHGAWPTERVGFSYAMSELRDNPAGDERPAALLSALHDCVAALAPGATSTPDVA